MSICKGTPADCEAIIALYERESGRALNKLRLHGFLESLPSAVAYSSETLQGFGFCTPFAPDIVQLGNICVLATARDKGLGSQLVELIESQACEKFHSIILSNSMLYTGIVGKRPATSFYERLGYRLIWSTGDTNVFAKQLNRA